MDARCLCLVTVGIVFQHHAHGCERVVAIAGEVLQHAEVVEILFARRGTRFQYRGVLDREILLLRHAEELPFDEIACLLDITPAAARKRFGRALIRLQKALTDAGILE